MQGQALEPAGRESDDLGLSAWGIAADRLDLGALMGLGSSKAGLVHPSENPYLRWRQEAACEKLLAAVRLPK